MKYTGDLATGCVTRCELRSYWTPSEGVNTRAYSHSAPSVEIYLVVWQTWEVASSRLVASRPPRGRSKEDSLADRGAITDPDKAGVVRSGEPAARVEDLHLSLA